MIDHDALLDERSNADTRAVLEDLERSSYESSAIVRTMCALWFYWDAADADADAAAAATAATAAAATAAATAAAAAAAADADAAAAAAAAATTAAAATAAATAAAAAMTIIGKDPRMDEGLTLIKLPGYYAVTRIGWLRRKHGDEYELVPGSRAVWRTNGSRLLEHIAADGPGTDHDMAEPSKVPWPVHRLLVAVPLPANEKAWGKHCPRPKDWIDRK
jgi:hypothetical protein